MYTLETDLIVQAGLEKTWDFLKNPANLNSITPPDLHFEIITEVPETMFEGLLIEYRVAIPLLGNQKWVAEIKHIRDRQSFVDEQRLGPYRFWYHYHEISQTNGGVKIIDRVHYAVPFSIFGQLFHRIYIRKTLERIFAYRKIKLAEILSG